MSIAEKLVTIAENEQKVYNKGFEDGKAEGGNTEEAYNQGVADGKQAEYDRFWALYQENGARTNYACAFGGAGWNVETFKPKYDIKPIDTSYMMFRQHNQDNEPYDLVEHLEEIGVELDLSNCTFVSYTFNNAKLNRVGVINLSKGGTLSNVFEGCTVETIDKVILNSNGTNGFSNTFYNCTNLKNITFEGVIGKNGLNFSYSPLLTHDSLMSIINCLKDYSGTSSYSITLGATNLAKLTDTEKAIATQKGWTLA